jgi:hypothetical protein
MIFGESIRCFLLFAHGLATFALVGSASHALAAGISELRGGDRWDRSRVLLANILIGAYAVTFLTGIWLYPYFRVEIRAACLDPHFPVFTGLFEIKEHWLAIGLGLLLAHRTLATGAVTGRPRALAAIFMGTIVLVTTVIGVAIVAGDLALCPEVLP